MCGVASSPEHNDWRGEDDHRTLTRAAEIMADRLRMQGVVRHQRKTQMVQKKMASMLKGFKLGGSFKLKPSY